MKRFLVAFLAVLALPLAVMAQAASAPTDGAHFLAASINTLLNPADSERLLVFTLVALGGMVFHYIKRWVRGEIPGGLLRYFFRDYPRQTAAAFGTLLGTIGTMFLTGQLSGLELNQLILMAVTTGYTVDSVTNKGGDLPGPTAG